MSKTQKMTEIPFFSKFSSSMAEKFSLCKEIINSMHLNKFFKKTCTIILTERNIEKCAFEILLVH